MTPRTARPRRAAFTLIELLVVVTIIALLAGLLLVGIQRVARVGATAQAVNDISNLNVACEKFKQEFGFFPPSVFIVPTAKNSNDPNYVMLASMFNSWGRTTAQLADGTAFPAAQRPALAGITLDGNQSMVYFLGGPTQTGWATDGPYAPTAGATAVKGPYMDFKQDRLDGTLGGPRHYLDPFKNPANPNGTPFAYFGSTTGGKYPVPATGVKFSWGGVDVFPFVEQTRNPPAVSPGVVVKHVNQGGVQIISAGEDGVFGPGCPLVGTKQCRYEPGASDPASLDPKSPYGEGDKGADDLANFNGGSKLGVGK